MNRRLLTSRRTRFGLATLGAVFVLSRYLAFWRGLRFDATPLETFWQFLDPQLLVHDLGRSLLFLHSQPPLPNAALGLSLKIAPESFLAGFQIALLVMGLALCLGSYILFLRLGLSRGLAWTAAALLAVRPEALLYESWLLYDLPVATLLVVAALLIRPAAGGSAAARHLFFWTLAILALTRSFFHLIFLLLIVLVLSLPRPDRRRWLLAAGLPILVVVVLYAKNLVLFGNFGSSSWMGINLARIATAGLPDGERLDLVAAGTLSAASGIAPFSPIEKYPESYRSDLRYPDIPAVAALRKSNGTPNYNHEGFVAIGHDLRRDALWIGLHRPQIYLSGVARAVYNFTRPGSEEMHLRRRAPEPGSLAARLESLGYLRVHDAFTFRGEPRDLFLVPLVGIPLALVIALWLSFRSAPPESLMLARFLGLTLLYVVAVGTLCEVWENARFRYYVDIIWVGLALLSLQTVLRRGTLYYGRRGRSRGQQRSRSMGNGPKAWTRILTLIPRPSSTTLGP